VRPGSKGNSVGYFFEGLLPSAGDPTREVGRAPSGAHNETKERV
jgi:hypothetical protein